MGNIGKMEQVIRKTKDKSLSLEAIKETKNVIEFEQEIFQCKSCAMKIFGGHEKIRIMAKKKSSLIRFFVS